MDPYREPSDFDRPILVVGLCGQVIGVDRKTGQIRWRNGLPGGGTTEVSIAFRHGVLVVSSDDNVVFRIDYQTGRTLWKAATRKAGRATIVVEPELIVVGKAGYLSAFDHDGALLWQQDLPDTTNRPMALAFPNNVTQADGV